MAEKKIDLKQKVGNDFVDIHPTTKWANIQDKPTTFTPTAHTHTISEVTGLQAALDNDIEHTHVGSQIYVKSEELGKTLNDWATSIENELSNIKQEVEDAFNELATLMEGV